MPERDLELLRQAAIQSGEIAKHYFESDVQTWDKGDGQGPVTQADLEIDQMLRTNLLGARPSYGWLSEETEDDAARLGQNNVFIIDPIDGTRSFIKGQVNFAHSLAIAKGGTVVAAVVYLPMKDMLFEAAIGQGARLNGETVLHSGAAELGGARMLAQGSQFKDDLWAKGIPPIERHFRSSLAYRLCLVAQGRFDGMFTLRDAWEWDIAAGDLICREAGATVTTRFGKTPIYNNRKPQQPGIFAAAPDIHSNLLAHV